LKKPLDSRHRGGIDLHIHSTASDGTCTPSEILRMASEIGLEAISITDHDTLEGIRSALSGCDPAYPRLLTGVEISTRAPQGFQVGGSLHIIGYGVDIDDQPLQLALGELQTARDARVPLIVKQLNAIGIPLSMTHVMAQAGEGSLGRPHIARALVEMGVAADIDDVFDRLLSKGRPGYVDKYRIPCRQAIDLIRQAGGVAVLAHPYLVPGGDQSDSLAKLLHALCDCGLEGIETYYPQHTPQAVALCLEMARRFDLLVTGGTDFHGDLSPDIQIGRGKDDMHIAFELYEALIARMAGKS
jgi:3',5'-nucleoside bisphosphate phosphatase